MIKHETKHLGHEKNLFFFKSMVIIKEIKRIASALTRRRSIIDANLILPVM